MRNDNERSLLDTQLIQLSYIFKNKFIVKVINDKVIQYDNELKPCEDKHRYKVLIEIKENSITFRNGKIPVVCIIKGWYSKPNDIYFIGLQVRR